MLQFVYGKMLVFTIAEKKRGIQVNIFHISPQKHRLLVLIGMPRRDASNEYPQSVFADKQKQKKNIKTSWLKKKQQKGSVADSEGVQSKPPAPSPLDSKFQFCGKFCDTKLTQNVHFTLYFTHLCNILLYVKVCKIVG